jgi:amidophosphoribosyltransferase
MRISSPPTRNPCYYGIDTPTREELIAASQPLEEIRRYLDADSLAYLSMEGLYSFVRGSREGFCDACFSGDYPVPIDEEPRARQLHLFEAREARAR